MMQTQTAPAPKTAAPQYNPDMVQRAWARAAMDLRKAAGESLLDFVPQVDPRLIRPYYLAPLASAIEQVRTEQVRVTVSVPPRHGKTSLLILGALWLLLGDPSMMIAYISYAAGIARNKSRMARDYARDLGLQARPDADALHEWLLPAGGGFRSGGIGGPLTGMGFRCFPAGTPIATERGDVPIEQLSPGGPLVVAFDHRTNRTTLRPVVATRKSASEQLVEVGTASGRRFTCTADHRIFVPGRGYTEAGDLWAGAPLVTLDGLDEVRGTRPLFDGAEVYDLQVEGCHNFFAADVLVHNCLMVDDPVKNRAEAESRIIRQRHWDWFTSTAVTRVTMNGSIIVSHTRWHDDDLIGRLKRETERFMRTRGEEGEWWVHINLPAIDNEPRDDGIDPTGLALCPEIWPLRALLKKRRAVGEYDWSALYQGNPRPRGAKIFHEPTAFFETVQLEGRRILIGVDVAGTASTSANWTVAVVMAIRGRLDDAQADIIEVRRWQNEIPQVARDLETLQRRYNGAPLIIEGSGIGKAVPQLIRDANAKLRITVVYPVADKWVRAQRYAAAWNAGRVRLPKLEAQSQAMAEFIRVHTDFTGSNDAQDDDVDAAAHAFNYYQARGGVAKYVAFSGGDSLISADLD